MIHFEGVIFTIMRLALGLVPQQLSIGTRGLKKLTVPSRCSLMGGCLQAGLEDGHDAESSYDNNYGAAG